MNEVRVSRLHRGRVARVNLPAGGRVLVARGECWLTAAGVKDYVLRPGDEYHADGETEVVLQAFEKAVVYAVRHATGVAESDRLAPESILVRPTGIRPMSPLAA
jgi:hypothetical protein